MDIILTIEGLNKLRRRLSPPESLYAQPWRDGMTEIAEAMQTAAVRAAPVRTGKLRDSIRTVIQRKPFPQWIATRVKARGPLRMSKKKGKRGRYPYPKLLEFSKRHGHFGWLRNSVGPVIEGAERELDKIGARIADAWGRDK